MKNLVILLSLVIGFFVFMSGHAVSVYAAVTSCSPSQCAVQSCGDPSCSYSCYPNSTQTACVYWCKPGCPSGWSESAPSGPYDTKTVTCVCGNSTTCYKAKPAPTATVAPTQPPKYNGEYCEATWGKQCGPNEYNITKSYTWPDGHTTYDSRCGCSGPTATPVPKNTPTNTPTPTRGPTPTNTPTPPKGATATPTNTPTPRGSTPTNTPTPRGPTNTPTPTRPPVSTPTPTPEFSTAMCTCDGMTASQPIIPGQPVTFTANSKVVGADTTKATVKDMKFYIAVGDDKTGTLIGTSGPVSTTTSNKVEYQASYTYTMPQQVTSGQVYRAWAQIDCVQKTAMAKPQVLVAGANTNTGFFGSIANFFVSLFGGNTQSTPRASFESSTNTQTPTSTDNKKSLQLQTFSPASVLDTSCTTVRFEFK